MKDAGVHTFLDEGESINEDDVKVVVSKEHTEMKDEETTKDIETKKKGACEDININERENNDRTKHKKFDNGTADLKKYIDIVNKMNEDYVNDEGEEKISLSAQTLIYLIFHAVQKGLRR